MDKAKLKLIIRNMELLVDSLKSEVYSDVDAYRSEDLVGSAVTSYDEVFEDDDS